MIFRKAEASDNKALIELTRQTPMEGAVTVYVDRSPDFFTLSKLQGKSFEVFVAEEDGKIIGCVSTVERDIRYKGREKKQLYGCDLKVHPGARGKKLGKKLAWLFLEKACENELFEMAEVEVITKNNSSLNIVSWLGDEICPSVHSGMAGIYQILPYRKYSVENSLNIRKAKNSDTGLICSMLEKTYADYEDAPVFSEEWFLSLISAHDSFSIEDILIAERDGSPAAMAGFWDQSRIRRTVVEKMPFSAKITMMGLSLISPFFSMPSLPKEGDSLKYLFLRFPACFNNDIDALSSLLRHKSNEIRKMKKYHFIWAGFHEADSMAKMLEGMWKLKMNVNVFHFAVSDSAELHSKKEAQEHPVFTDFSLI